MNKLILKKLFKKKYFTVMFIARIRIYKLHAWTILDSHVWLRNFFNKFKSVVQVFNRANSNNDTWTENFYMYSSMPLRTSYSTWTLPGWYIIYKFSKLIYQDLEMLVLVCKLLLITKEAIREIMQQTFTIKGIICS